jgi:hypothetical protein
MTKFWSSVLEFAFERGLIELWRTRRDTIAFSPAYFSAFEDADRTAF